MVDVPLTSLQKEGKTDRQRQTGLRLPGFHRLPLPQSLADMPIALLPRGPLLLELTLQLSRSFPRAKYSRARTRGHRTGGTGGRSVPPAH